MSHTKVQCSQYQGSNWLAVLRTEKRGREDIIGKNTGVWWGPYHSGDWSLVYRLGVAAVPTVGGMQFMYSAPLQVD